MASTTSAAAVLRKTVLKTATATGVKQRQGLLITCAGSGFLRGTFVLKNVTISGVVQRRDLYRFAVGSGVLQLAGLQQTTVADAEVVPGAPVKSTTATGTLFKARVPAEVTVSAQLTPPVFNRLAPVTLTAALKKSGVLKTVGVTCVVAPRTVTTTTTMTGVLFRAGALLFTGCNGHLTQSAVMKPPVKFSTFGGGSSRR